MLREMLLHGLARLEATSGPGYVLLVDGNAGRVHHTVRVLRDFLASSQVVVAGDGDQAKRVLTEQGCPSALLLRIDLDTARTMQLLEWVCSRPRPADLPVFALTSSPVEEDMLQDLTEDITGFIRLPATPGDIDDLPPKERNLRE